jgi:hypothetical protein
MDDLPVNLLDRPRAGAILDMLTRHGISWVNYRPAAGDHSQFRHYVQYRRRRSRHHLRSLGRPLRRTANEFTRDHVAPPAAVPPDDVTGRSIVADPSPLRTVLKILFPGYVRNAEELVAGPDRYDTYGFRVPAVIISPYARRDCVLSEVFDHTSVLKLVEEKWNLPALTRGDAAATSPLGALDLSAPPVFLTPPPLSAPSLAWGAW